jgi:hypothetical protein
MVDAQYTRLCCTFAKFFIFRNDREFSTGGGICTYVSCDITCKRLTEFENPKIESLWLSLRPKRLPRSISIILVAVIYHTTSSGASENWDLYNHIQSNVDAFLRNQPDALVLVTGDFNPTSTGFDVNRVKRLTGLSQIIRVTTRDNSILDWCLTNMKNLFLNHLNCLLLAVVTIIPFLSNPIKINHPIK